MPSMLAFLGPIKRKSCLSLCWLVFPFGLHDGTAQDIHRIESIDKLHNSEISNTSSFSVYEFNNPHFSMFEAAALRRFNSVNYVYCITRWMESGTLHFLFAKYCKLMRFLRFVCCTRQKHSCPTQSLWRIANALSLCNKMTMEDVFNQISWHNRWWKRRNNWLHAPSRASNSFAPVACFQSNNEKLIKWKYSSQFRCIAKTNNFSKCNCVNELDEVCNKNIAHTAGWNACGNGFIYGCGISRLTSTIAHLF